MGDGTPRITGLPGHRRPSWADHVYRGTAPSGS